jgi:putative endonuclease
LSKPGYIYIVTNKNHTVLYTGVTSNLPRRILQHKNHVYARSFTKRYNIEKLVYYEEFDHIVDAIKREKQIKAGSRQDKLDLIKRMNPEWIDLYERIASEGIFRG